MELEVFTKTGSPTGRKITVSDRIFDAQPNEHAVYLAIQSQMTNKRQGTASVKSRSMVAGGGRKPWRQKGRGVARAGTTRSPIWRGGGIIHGPNPHPYSYKLPKKMKQLARISVLSTKTRDDQLKVLEDFSIEKSKTKEMAAILKDFGLGEIKTLILTTEHDPQIQLASRNIKNLNVTMATDASTYELLDCRALLIMESAIEKFEGLLQS